MRAVVFRPSRPRRALARSLGELTRAVWWGRISGVSLRGVSEPDLPGPGWARVQVLQAGVSQQELGALAYASPALLEPFGSWPAVPGREVVGRVVEAGPEVALDRDQRVVVDPFLSCAARGFGDDPCPACRRSEAALCHRAGEEGRLTVEGRPLRRGDRLGRHADLPGGWCERILVHRDQLLPVDRDLPDRLAVLVEPLASALHAVRLAGVGDGEVWQETTTGEGGGAVRAEAAPERRSASAGAARGAALVLGRGVRALGTVWALRRLGFGGQVVVLAEREAEAALARGLGAHRVVRDGVELREAMADTGARAYMPVEGEEVWAGGGFARVFDWTASGPPGASAGPGRGLRLVAPGGILALPVAGPLPEGELALAAARGVTVQGVAGYGPGGPAASTLALARDLLTADPGAISGTVTHVYPLEQFREALDAAAGRGREHPVKILLDPEA